MCRFLDIWILTVRVFGLPNSQISITLYVSGQATRLSGHQPVIELYDSAQDLDHERVFHDARRALGFDLEEISGAQAAELEPSIASDFAYAVVLKDWRSVVDAKRFVMELRKNSPIRIGRGYLVSQEKQAASAESTERCRVAGRCGQAGAHDPMRATRA